MMNSMTCFLRFVFPLCMLFAVLPLIGCLPTRLASDGLLQKRITHSGRGTWFYPGQGNCGHWNTSSEFVLAISIDIYHNGNNCGQWVHITNTDTNQTVYAQTVDSCQACDPGSIDMSPATFSQLAELSQGVVPIEWHFMNRDWSPPASLSY